MSVIESKDYGETRRRLTKDEIVRKMASEMEDARPWVLAELVHPDGSPKHGFMLAATDEYRARGGKDGGHIGAIAEAVLLVLKGEA